VDLSQSVDRVLGEVLDDLAPGDHVEGVVGVGEGVLLGVETGADELVALFVLGAGEGLADLGAAIRRVAGEGEVVVAELLEHEGDVERGAAELEEAAALLRVGDEAEHLAPERQAAVDEDLVDDLVAVVPAEAQEVPRNRILVAFTNRWRSHVAALCLTGGQSFKAESGMLAPWSPWTP
jgi:hypothetical protein